MARVRLEITQPGNKIFIKINDHDLLFYKLLAEHKNIAEVTQTVVLYS